MDDARRDRLARLDRARSRIFPSLLNCDFGILAHEIEDAARSGAQAVHWDVMDGDFCPNFTYGPPIIKSLRPRTNVIFDAHLMVNEPGKFLDDFLAAGCDIVTFHIEVEPDPRAVAGRIRASGALAGLSLNPKTPFATVAPYLGNIDLLLVMSVQPGFGGQAFDPTVLDKVRQARAVRPELLIQIDGGINSKTIVQAAGAGTDLFVVGSAFYGVSDRAATYKALEQLAESA